MTLDHGSHIAESTSHESLLNRGYMISQEIANRLPYIYRVYDLLPHRVGAPPSELRWSRPEQQMTSPVSMKHEPNGSQECLAYYGYYTRIILIQHTYHRIIYNIWTFCEFYQMNTNNRGNLGHRRHFSSLVIQLNIPVLFQQYDTACLFPRVSTRLNWRSRQFHFRCSKLGGATTDCVHCCLALYLSTCQIYTCVCSQ